MGARWLFGAIGLVIATSLGACSAAPLDEAVGGDRASVREAEFDKNAVLTDTALRDTSALTLADIQAFLEETPWGNTSVLADYEEDGKSAAEIMYEAATKHGINPLELLVRVQMEQGLVSKESASDESITLAFGCGCPHSPVCSPKYEGFANQADCAAGTLSRSMDRALTSKGTASGWKKGEEKLTQDAVEIIPANAATAALYTYTPWVGEAGGGRKGIGGVSLHHTVWTRFADAVGYGVSNNETPREQPTEVLEAGTDPNTGGNEEEVEEEEEVDAGPAPTEDPEEPTEDPEPSDSPDAGPADGDGTSDETPAEDEGEDDDDILSEGNAPPATNAPPPRQSGSRTKASRRGGEDLTEATEEELSAGKRKAAGGCSSSGGNASDASLAALVMAAAGLVAKRRRRES